MERVASPSKLARLIDRAGLTHVELARRARCSRKLIYQLVRGRQRTVAAETAELIRGALRDELLESLEQVGGVFVTPDTDHIGTENQ